MDQALRICLLRAIGITMSRIPVKNALPWPFYRLASGNGIGSDPVGQEIVNHAESWATSFPY